MNAQNGPVSLYGFFHPRPDRAGDLKEMLTALIAPTRREPGALSYDLHEEPDGTLFLHEIWRTQQDLDRHRETPHMRAFLEAFWDDRPTYLTRDIEAHTGRPLGVAEE
jgi:quinol monooxygenase YgiN